MIYEYHCACGERFDVVKPASQMEAPETCSNCGSDAKRQFVPSHIHLVGTGVEHAEYNPGLGCIVKNKRHRAELARQRGLVEVGNEPIEKIHTHFEREREERRERAWADADRGWVGDGSS